MEKNKKLIVKSNSLLQHPLYKTSIELKIFSRIVLAIREAPERDTFTFSVSSLLNDFGCNEDDYDRLKKVAKNMSGKTIDINQSSSDDICDIVVIFRRITVSKKGLITFKIEDDIKPFIIDLTNNFTQYYFENIAKLKSSFSIRMYEFLKQYESIGNRKVTITALRHFLNISDEKYPLYADLKKKAIFVSQKELKEKTDLSFEFEEIKLGRKVHEINFIIGEGLKKPITIQRIPTLTDTEIAITLNPIYDLIKKLIPNIADSKLREILTTYEMAQVFNAVAIVEKYKTKDTDADLAGLFVSALKQGWNNQSTPQPAKQQSSPATPTAQPLQTEVTAPPRADNSAVLVTFLELPEPEQQQLITEFLQSSHVNEFVVDKWNSCKKHRENPLDKPLIKGVFIKFLLEK
jgi:plasmid replication initiation protein